MAAKIPKVLKVDARDQTILCDGITVAFFLPMPLDAVADGIRQVVERFFGTPFAKTLRWCSIGADAEEWKRADKKTFDRCLALLTRESTKKRKLTAFEVFDGKRDGDAPTCGVSVLGNPRDRKQPLETNLLQFYFPSQTIDSAVKAESFVKWVSESAALLPFVYGYASPGLHWGEAYEIPALTAARGFAKRHAGFDVQNNESSRSDIDTMTRGAKWLTFLGPDVQKKLGGPKKIQSIATDEITTTVVGHGTLIRAGALPEIGDRNRKQDTPLLKAVARLLRPVTLFDEPALKQSVFSVDDPEFFAEWEQRFFDDAQ